MRASKCASVVGSVPLDGSKPTRNTVAEIMEPNKITLNLKLDTDRLSSTLKSLAKKFSTETAAAIDASIVSFTNFGKTMRSCVPLRKFRFPVSVGTHRVGELSLDPAIIGFDVGDRRGSKSIVASGQDIARPSLARFGSSTPYASVVHETFSNLSMDKYVAKHLRRFR